MDTLHLVVDLRNHEEMAALQATIESQQSEIAKLKQDIYTWTHYVYELQEANDEIRYLKSLLRLHKIEF